jgi:dTDP-4-amino-4,6-dideoxygalactose transaminase
VIPFFDGRHSFSIIWPDVRRRLEEVMDRGKFSHGIMVERFERAICEYTGARHALGVNSGTDALVLLMRAAGIGEGDEVIVPSFTFVASATSVAHVGATPVFVDIDPVTYTMDVEQVRAAITPRTRAIMPVHLFAQMADMAPLLAVAEERGLLVVEDSAEGIGMSYGGTHAGLLGLGGVLSFFPTKTLGALGDAGMVITNDNGIAEKVRVMRHHGRTGRTIDNLPGISHESVLCGTNSKMDDIQAAVLITRLAQLEADIERRAELARFYDARLGPLAPQVRTPTIVARSVATRHVFYVYLIAAERKRELVGHLREHGVGTEDYYPWPLHRQPCFRYLSYDAGVFPNAESACAKAIALPFYPDLTFEDVDRVCSVIEVFYAKEGRRS